MQPAGDPVTGADPTMNVRSEYRYKTAFSELGLPCGRKDTGQIVIFTPFLLL